MSWEIISFWLESVGLALGFVVVGKVLRRFGLGGIGKSLVSAGVILLAFIGCIVILGLIGSAGYRPPRP